MSEPLQEGTTKGNKKNYKQKIRRKGPAPKPAPKPLPKVYVEIKDREIPLYDPYTGEPNPYYEELTGKKNPLLEKPKDNLENTKNGTNHKIPTHGKDIIAPEFVRNNRFLVILPEELGIEPFFVTSITGPKIIFDNVKVLGIKTHIKKYVIEDLVLRFKPTIGQNINKKLFDMGLSQKYFSMRIEMLNPTGVIFETWLMSGCQIKSVDLGTFDYSNSSISDCEVVISPSDYIVK